jgi:hypothetical protein
MQHPLTLAEWRRRRNARHTPQPSPPRREARLGTGLVRLPGRRLAPGGSPVGKLIGDNAVTALSDKAFNAGPANRPAMEDPTERRPGQPKNWVVGGPGTPVDALIITASDDIDDLADAVHRVQDSLYALRVVGRTASSGARIAFIQHGDTQPGALAGHEHLGFLDGFPAGVAQQSVGGPY